MATTAFSTRLKEAMTMRGLRAVELAEATGLSRARISQYTNGKYVPGADGICRLARALGVSEAWLLGENDPATDSLLPTPDNVSALSLRRYPVLGRIACGAPILAVEETDGEYVLATDSDADFCLIARGDSMIGARIFDGDEVLCRHTDVVNNGDIAAVIIDDEATLKRVYYYPEEQRLILSPENPAYPPLVFIGKELEGVRIIGKAVSVLTRL